MKYLFIFMKQLFKWGFYIFCQIIVFLWHLNFKHFETIEEFYESWNDCSSYELGPWQRNKLEVQEIEDDRGIP